MEAIRISDFISGNFVRNNAMKLYSHQQKFVDKALNKWGVWHGCGTGKTLTGLEIAKSRVKSCLVICPKGVKSKWEKEVEAYPTIEFFVVSKEEFRRDWKEIQAFEAVIIDEAHHFSSIKSQLYKNILKYISVNKVEYIWPMTATPYRSNPFNIFALAKILGYPLDFMKFRYYFFNPQYFGNRMVWLPKKNIKKDIANLVRQIGDVVSFEECADFPPITHKIEEFEMTKSQKEAIDALDLVEANPLTRYMRIHQICSGIGAETGKTERILELAESNAKLAVFCRYTAQISNLRDALKKEGHEVFIIDGSVSNKEEVSHWVELCDNCVVLLQMDSAEGFELPSVNVICFASMSYSYLAYEQSCGRFIRINKKNGSKLFIYLLTKGKDSIDRAVYDNIMAKQDFSVEIYSKKHG